MNHFQSITCMPAYAGSSFEELRVLDYNQNRRYGTANGTSNGFGTATFGSAAPGTSGGLFGSAPSQSSPFGQPAGTNATSIFGQNNAPQTSSIFGSSTNTGSTPFGPTQSTGLFGANNTSSMFGANNPATQTSNMFGSNNSTAATPAFGQSNNGSNPFGAQSNSSNLFGAGSNNNNAFGQNNNTATAKPFSFGGSTNTGFGQNTNGPSNAGSNMFGSNNTTANTGTSLFGQNNPASTSSGLFGQAAQNNNSGFSFGATNPTNSGSNNADGSSFSFGTENSSQNNTTNPSKPFSFGASAGNSGTFGASTTNSGAKPFSFGNTAGATTTPQGSGLFGGSNQSAAPAVSNSLFGNNSSSGGLFGANKGVTNGQSSNSATPGSFFGGASSGNSLFGANASQPTSNNSGLFGTPANQNAANAGPFGSSTLFGNNQNSASFNQSQNTGSNGQASIGNAYGNNPLFSSVQSHAVTGNSPGPIAKPLVTNSMKKKPAMLPHFKLASRSPAPSPRTLSRGLTALGASPSTTPRKSNFSMFDEELLINPEAFSPRNMKRLVIERKSNDLDILSGGLDIKGVTHGPPKAVEVQKPAVDLRKAAHETGSIEVEAEPGTSREPTATHVSTTRTSAAKEEVQYRSPAPSGKTNPKSNNDGTYWTSPAMSTLLDYSKAELSKVKDFKVGRRGYGQVTFLAPVDISTLEMVEDVAGKIVAFEGKMCTVYPDESMKPQPGKGLNVPATITLENCYPLSKDKREPIRDTDHPRFQQHIDRLKRMTDTEFVDYLADSGTWIFKVKRF